MQTMSSYLQCGTVLTDHTFSVPLDHDRPGGQQIEVFAREVVAAGRAADRLPWLVFLQGGPGFGAPRPHGADSWLGRALADYRVLLLDQRGTGRSTPASRQTLARFGTAAEQAGYLLTGGLPGGAPPPAGMCPRNSRCRPAARSGACGPG